MGRRTVVCERGQVLVYVAVSMVTLLMVVALAIEVGHLYVERRNMQNAADAGALAGAREICFGTPSLAQSTGQAWAQSPYNTADTATATVDTAAGTVTVTADKSVSLFFGGLLGGGATVGVHATAVAACGLTSNPCGLFPTALDDSAWNLVEDTCGKVFYVWDGDHNDTDDSPTGPDCNECDCDIDAASPGDEVFPGTGRAWMDFSAVIDPLHPSECDGGGCGAAEIKCWIESLEPGSIRIPSCIPGDSGVKAGVKKEIEERAALPYPGSIVKVPIYTGTCAGTTCTGGFMVTKVGCIKILGWEQWNQNTGLPYKDGTKGCWKGKVVKVEVSCDVKACASSCGGTIGGGCPAGSSVCSVSLVQ